MTSLSETASDQFVIQRLLVTSLSFRLLVTSLSFRLLVTSLSDMMMKMMM